MNCKKCEISVFDAPLQRVNPIGEKGVFWCTPCTEKHEPELAKNITEDKSQIVKDLEQICYKQPNQ